MQIPKTVILSAEAVAVLKRARDAWTWPTNDTGVWTIVSDDETAAADALAEAGLIVEEYSFLRGRMLACITGAGVVALLSYEQQGLAQEGSAQ